MFPKLHYLMFTLMVALAVATTGVRAANEIGDQNFVEKASAAGIAEVEAGKLALEKATNPKVKEFAQTMIDDHTAAGKKLKALAQQQKLEVSDDAALMDQAKAKILEMREAESFDRAYINNQVNAHQDAVDLFKQAANSENAAIANFAKQTLPKLEHHLKMVKGLANEVAANP